ncbi:MAG: hypothetical protein OXF85_01340 [Candidatus Saccharibacteria bacterium]|nr:hypothetical protein [Candidatus Saccharibacteria bacterium]MCY4011016.1 hypothetical protein [Candidatus Saccharibacteria bacterium]MCY4088802.1 hypothetical protein [Candidatus Saccharibacteria bacterium]
MISRGTSRGGYILLLVLMIILLVSGGLSLYGLRHNHLIMEEYKQAVFEADRQGQPDYKVDQLILRLKAHVENHMNANLQQDSDSEEDPIQLSYRHYRDTLVQWQKRMNNIDAKLVDQFKDIKKQCQTEDSLTSERLLCLKEKTRNIDFMPDPPLIAKADYTYNFTSPRFSTDLAGVSLVLFFMTLSIFVLRLLF